MRALAAVRAERDVRTCRRTSECIWDGRLERRHTGKHEHVAHGHSGAIVASSEHARPRRKEQTRKRPPASYILFLLLPTSCFLFPASYFLLPTCRLLLPDCYFPLPTSYFLLASSSMVWIGGHERRQCLCTCTCTCCCTCTCLCTCCCMHMPVYMYEYMFTCCCTCTCLSIAQLMHESLLPCGMAARAGARACTQAGVGKHLCMRPGKRAARLYLHCRCCWLANDRRCAESLVVDSCVAQHDG